MATTTPAPEDGGFFDDDNNKAMFLVLPSMIIIYGSCCLIYCIHRCRRYCRTRKKRNRKEQKKMEKEKERMSYTNFAVVDIEDTGRREPPNSSLVLESLEHGAEGVSDTRAMVRSRADMIDDVLTEDNLAGAVPGYEMKNMNQQMKHLDIQLQAAFRLTETSKQPLLKESSADPPQKSCDKATMTNLDDDPPKPKVVVEPMPGQSRRSRGVQKIYDSEGNKLHVGDYQSIYNVRHKLNKEMPKSFPDLDITPNENMAALRRVIPPKQGPKRIFLSSQ